MSTLSINSSALSILLRDVQQAAGTDGTLPMLTGVLLNTARSESGAGVLAATATNRYMLLHGHAATDSGELPGQVWLTNSQVSQLLAMLRPYTTRSRAVGQRTEITVAAGQIRFAQTLLDDDLGSIAVSFKHATGTFPDFAKLINAARDAEPSSDMFGIDGKLLVKVARIADQRGEFLRMRSSGRTQAVVIAIGENLLALTMPVRLGGNATLDIPVYAVPVMTEAVAA